MNFNFGEVLTRAWQIIWKHKVLWIPGIIFTLISLLSLPINLIFNDPFPSYLGDPSEMNQRIGSMLLTNGLILLVFFISIPAYVIGMSIPSLGTIHLEKGNNNIIFGELFRESLSFFWRVLGVLGLIVFGMFIGMMAFMACFVLFSMTTMGFGALCAVPLFLLFIPIGILVYSLIAQGMSAVLVDNLGVFNALQRAWDLIKKNFGVMAIISIILYFASLLVSMVYLIPTMIPMFGFFSNIGAAPDMQAFEELTRNMYLWPMIFSPLYMLLQGIFFAFSQSVWTLTYMRLTKSQDNTPVVLEENA